MDYVRRLCSSCNKQLRHVSNDDIGFQNLGEMMTLGSNDAVVSPSFVDGLTLEGSIGHTARKIAYLIRLPTDEHKLKVGISWLTKSAIDSVSLLQSTLYKVLSSS
ncbi:unnamed protein product [Sphenostylis stenocarpa]|uniref:Uncharacterized protein n=1 Tax=Sphenostylis stenocarpa TaxID=92480 RepID=A0AA86S399_9FABA|nr:unnamed protein product [Sphenostylis stenocarpa]